LLHEFGPASSIDQTLIEALASDYVRSAQLARLAATTAAAPDIPAGLRFKWRLSRRSRRCLRIARKVMARLASGEQPDCTPDEAKWLAREIVRDVRELFHCHAQVAVEPAGAMPDGLAQVEKCEFELEDERRHRHLLATVAPSAGRLRDRTYVEEVLGGASPHHVDDLKHIREILQRHMPWWKLSIRALQPHEQHVREIYAAAKNATQLSPADMLKLQRCQRQVSQSIEQKRKQLRKRREDRLPTGRGGDSPPTASGK
jgi:hypothetical protein